MPPFAGPDVIRRHRDRLTAAAMLFALALASAVASPTSAAANPASPTATAATAAPASGPEVIDDAWVVEFTAASVPADRLTALQGAGVTIRDRGEASRFALVEAGDPAAEALARHPHVARIRRPVPVAATATPNDVYFSEQWNLHAVQATTAWDTSTGRGAVVAVLDTGVHRALSDLQGTRFVAGYDFIEGDSDPQDDNGHGSHVIGTIAQTTDNSIGVAGLAHGASIMPVKVLDALGAGNDYLLAQGINFAVVNGADVINLSLAGTGSSAVLSEAIEFAHVNGVTIVAAAGNEGIDQIAFPAAYPEVIAVGAVTRANVRASYSNRGSELDLVAPGGDLTQDLDGDGYGDGILQQSFVISGTGDRISCFCFYEGTSMAVPHVSAAAALIVADGARSAAVVREALLASAKDLGPAGVDTSYGAGLLQAASALTVAAGLPEPEPSDPSAPPTDDPVGDPVDDPGTATHGQARDIDDSCPEEEVPDAGFTDVEDGAVHAFPIDCVAWRRITSGLTPQLYGPGVTVTRAQMATFLANAIRDVGGTLPDHPPDAFDDDQDSIHQKSINQLAAVGIVKGQLDRTYRPGAPVSRAQMATFLSSTIAHVTGQRLSTSIDYFDDDADSIHADAINAMAHFGIATGVGVRTYAPAKDVRRGAMASYLARALDYLIETAAAS